MAASKTSTGRIGPQKFDDGVVLHGNAPHTKRWQKHGHDRLYFESTKDDGGYVDLENGEVVDLEPYYESGIDEYEMQFNAESGKMELVAIPRAEVVMKHGAEERVIAEIPREVLVA